MKSELAKAVRALVLWVLLLGSAALGFSVVGTASLMVGNGAAIRNGLLLWAAVTLLSFVGMHLAIKRRLAAAMLAVLPAPAIAAFVCARYVMGA